MTYHAAALALVSRPRLVRPGLRAHAAALLAPMLWLAAAVPVYHRRGVRVPAMPPPEALARVAARRAREDDARGYRVIA